MENNQGQMSSNIQDDTINNNNHHNQQHQHQQEKEEEEDVTVAAAVRNEVLVDDNDDISEVTGVASAPDIRIGATSYNNSSSGSHINNINNEPQLLLPSERNAKQRSHFTDAAPAARTTTTTVTEAEAGLESSLSSSVNNTQQQQQQQQFHSSSTKNPLNVSPPESVIPRVENGTQLHNLLQQSQLSTNMDHKLGFLGLSVLQTIGYASLGSSIPTNIQLTKAETNVTNIFASHVHAAAKKHFLENPPFVHLSYKDSASQLAVGQDRLTVVGGMRGYRMARSSHGADSSKTDSNYVTYYYEVIIRPPMGSKEFDSTDFLNNLTAREFQLPTKNLRLAPQLMNKKDQVLANPSSAAHVRLGWSMRTATLQAPVGYDNWSYGIRDINGSRIHASKREDQWSYCGEKGKQQQQRQEDCNNTGTAGRSFGPGDVVGFAITLRSPTAPIEVLASKNSSVSSAPSSKRSKRDHHSSIVQPIRNHIRVFKNGKSMGELQTRSSKSSSNNSIKSGGELFDEIEDGVYFPAISCYMGGCCRINFGPHFVYKVKAEELPSNMKAEDILPMSHTCHLPLKISEAKSRAINAVKEEWNRSNISLLVKELFKLTIEIETQCKRAIYDGHKKKHLVEIRTERIKRELPCDDLI